MNERIALGVMLGVLLGAPAGQVQGQPAADRPITMVVPLPAGGTADLLCRLAAERASPWLGQQIVIDNRAGGAGGRVGTESVLRSPPDGHTLLCAPQLTYSITHLVFTRTAFDTRAMEPVSVLATYPLIVLARPGLPVDDLPKLIAYAKINPGKVNYGHQGKGNTGHLLGELLMLKGNFASRGACRYLDGRCRAAWNAERDDHGNLGSHRACVCAIQRARADPRAGSHAAWHFAG